MLYSSADTQISILLAEENGSPAPVKSPWTRPEKIAVCAACLSLPGTIGTIGNSVVNALNRQDTKSQAQQSKDDDHRSSLIDRKLDPVKSALEQRKDDQVGDRSDVQAIRTSLKEGLDGIREDLSKTAQLAQDTKADLAKLSGKVDGIDKNVDLLLAKQLRAAADLPGPVLAGQVDNVYALYELANERHLTVPEDTNDLLRTKLATVENRSQAFWPLAGILITNVSRVVNPIIRTNGQTLQNIAVEGNTFTGITVVLDGIHFRGNVCTQCVVVYNGGPTDTGKNIFINCAFVVSLKAMPPQSGQAVVARLLASDLRSVTL